MCEPYPIVEVPSEACERIEQMGTKPKFWFTREDGSLWLFKFNRQLNGEDWSEKIATECAALLGLPHARVELATFRDQRGVAALDFTGRGKIRELVHGNELLVRLLDPKYPRKENFKVRAHTVQLVLGILDRSFIGFPADFTPPAGVVKGGDLFLGYLLLDALVGNTDRHHENWAVVVAPPPADQPAETPAWVAPTFDHASCLGRELTDGERVERLSTRDQNRTVEAYARRARSKLYRLVTEPKPLTPAGAFAEASRERSAAAWAWIERLRGLNEVALQRIIDRVPGERMSAPARDFATAMLRFNRRSLLEMER